jgi:hypothetical protein
MVLPFCCVSRDTLVILVSHTEGCLAWCCRLIYVAPPDEASRADILAIHLRPMPLATGLHPAQPQAPVLCVWHIVVSPCDYATPLWHMKSPPVVHGQYCPGIACTTPPAPRPLLWHATSCPGSCCIWIANLQLAKLVSLLLFYVLSLIRQDHTQVP